MSSDRLGDAGSRGQRTFRHNVNRSTELSFKNELTNLAKRSIAEIGVTKDAILNMPLSEENETALKLKPNFKPKKPRDKRKSEPVFHDDLPPPKPQTVDPNHPIYNALDRENTSMQMRVEKPKKYPVQKDVVLTTEEMKKPHVTSVGVVPVRASEAVDGLKVLMKGKPAVPKEISPQRASSAPGKRHQSPIQQVEMDNVEEECSLPPTPMTLKEEEDEEACKPAIVGAIGTLAPVAMTHRPQPPAKPKTRLRPRRVTPSRVSDGTYEKYDEAIDSIDGEDGHTRSQGSSAYTVKSTKDLLEEAKQIARAGGRKRKASDSVKSQSMRSDAKSISSKGSGIGGAPVVPQPAPIPAQKVERSVDEIIASLKDGSAADQETEADKRIKEIMKTMRNRTKGVLGDDVFDEEEEMEEQSTAASHSDGGSARSTPEDQQEEKGEEGYTRKSSMAESDQAPSEVMRDALDKLSELRTAEPSMMDMETEPTTLDTQDMMGFDLELDLPQSDQEEEEIEKTETPDLRQAWIDLNAPAKVTKEDVLSINAEKAELIPKRSQTFISSWGLADVQEEEEVAEAPPVKKTKNIHHFCTMDEDVMLPDHMRGTWRRYHVPSKYDFLNSDKDNQRQESEIVVKGSPPASQMSQQEALERRQSQAARLILQEAQAVGQAGTTEQELKDWREKAQQVFDKPEVEITRVKLELKSDESFLHWYPAPPKWDVVPTKVKAVLFPEYHGAALAQDFDPSQQAGQESDDSEIEEEHEESIDPEAKGSKQRTLERIHGSARDLTVLGKERMKLQEEQASRIEQDITREETARTPRLESALSIVTQSTTTERSMEASKENIQPEKPAAAMQSNIADGGASGATMDSTTSGVPSASVPSIASKPSPFSRPPLPPIPPRPGTAPGNLGLEDEDFLVVYQDFGDCMQEISAQKKQLKNFKSGKQTPPMERRQKQEDKTEEEEEQEDEVRSLKEASSDDVASSVAQSARTPRSSIAPSVQPEEEELTPAEEALRAGRNYVTLKPGRKRRPLKKADMKRIEDIEKFLNAEPRKIKRSQSLPRKKRLVEREFRVPKVIHEHRGSVPCLLDFAEYKEKVDYKNELKSDERDWVWEVWNRWFDERYPPTPPSSESEEDDDEDESPYPMQAQTIEEEEKKRKSSVASVVYSASEVEVYPVTQGPEDEEGIALMEGEVERLTEEITSALKPRAFDLCRRGAILRKLGRIKPAKDDLDRAISMEPMFLDAYWHRHLVYSLLNQKAAALDDLNYILKFNKTHAGAYRAKAAIHREKEEITMAIINFGQAIKYDPDYESYFQRATMHEMRGEVLLAMEDYSQATKLCPTRTEALYKHAMHYFNNENWDSAIDDFTAILKIEPNNGKARMYRGRSYSMMKQWNPALEDLSAAVHMDPNNAKAYYYRGCLLRKLHPKKALQDLSVSLLLDDGEDNHLAYLHRGILYYAIGKHEEAIPDFESCLKLDHQMACAHVNLGLIYMTKMDNHHRAIKKFSAAIKSDPTYVKAYVCRAEAYTRNHDIKNALLDITRAIHLKPDVHHYYMYRGKLILQMGNLELAAFCVKHAAELNTGMTHSPTQEAIVQSFLKNYDKAIVALENAVKSTPVASLYMLLGKTQMKAQKWKGAVSSFQQALDLVEEIMKDAAKKNPKPWQDKQALPMEAAEMYYLIGMCQVEERDYFNAHEAFNNAIRVNNKYSEAYYQRGLVRLRLKQNRGIQDFNRALAQEPTLFQAFLSRAAYYGMKKQYTKAILNCNEVIKLQPKSIRAYLYRGALKYHIKAYALAIRDLTQAIAIDSKCTLAYFNRAVCYHDSGNWQKALQDYGIVLLLGERLNLQVLVNRGLLYYYRQDYPNALHDLKMAAEVFPRDKSIHHTLGLCYHKSGKLEEAVLSFTRALELDRFFLEALISRGNVYMDFGHHKGLIFARHDYERALHLSPECLPARVNLAYTLQVDSKYQQAWHQFTAAIQIDPTYKPALEGRAIINLQMSDTFAAFQDINASCRVRPTAELLTNRGVIYQFMGDKVNAMRDYQAALKQDNKYSLAYFNAANMYFHQRQFKQALDYYDSALIYNPKDESALLNRAITKVLQKDAKGALKDFSKALRLSPYSAHMYFNRGNLYTSLEQYEKAEKDYTKALYIQPDDPHVLTRRADVLGKLGARDKAVQDYRRAIEIQSKKRV